VRSAIRRRLAQGAGNAFGKVAAEVDTVLRWHAGYETMHRALGSVIVDATRPVMVGAVSPARTRSRTPPAAPLPARSGLSRARGVG
jgi:hypothetical protein